MYHFHKWKKVYVFKDLFISFRDSVKEKERRKERRSKGKGRGKSGERLSSRFPAECRDRHRQGLTPDGEIMTWTEIESQPLHGATLALLSIFLRKTPYYILCMPLVGMVGKPYMFLTSPKWTSETWWWDWRAFWSRQKEPVEDRACFTLKLVISEHWRFSAQITEKKMWASQAQLGNFISPFTDVH